ncbi:hypothetical protein MSG28_013830 [Choristoneura fumiferana]|uniref:Uncharacterized protein n=1 Tax=Choristoneura fumiferana TaxID=7141 RepID=A0ACC0K9T7_CHOFU|nr:hypothetical protein MSG28_013830 [Choristoneura fumiferana]
MCGITFEIYHELCGEGKHREETCTILRSNSMVLVKFPIRTGPAWELWPKPSSQLRSRRKAAKMLVAVVIMFAVCYLPVHLLSILTYSMDMKQNDQMTLFGLVSHVLCYANSAINPLIYNFMCGKFRREFRKLFCCSTQPALENSTTLTLISKFRKPSDLLTFNQRSHTTSSIKIGYRNGCT